MRICGLVSTSIDRTRRGWDGNRRYLGSESESRDDASVFAIFVIPLIYPNLSEDISSIVLYVRGDSSLPYIHHDASNNDDDNNEFFAPIHDQTVLAQRVSAFPSPRSHDFQHMRFKLESIGYSGEGKKKEEEKQTPSRTPDRSLS